MTHVLHQSALQLAQQYLKCERELVTVLQKIQAGKLFVTWGYSSLFDYCRRALSLSESQSYNFVAVSRRCNEIPELQKAIQSEQINISRAKRILPVLDKENAALWIEKAAMMDQRQLEKAVAAQNPTVQHRPALKPTSESQALLHLGISLEEQNDVLRTQEVLTQKLQRPVTLREGNAAAHKEFLDKNDPLRISARATLKAEKKSKIAAPAAPPEKIPTTKAVAKEASPPRPATSRYIPAAIQHKIHQRDQGQCRHKNPDGSRCCSKTFLEIHHIQPLSEGGHTTLENLITVCSAHHKHTHLTHSPGHHNKLHLPVRDR